MTLNKEHYMPEQFVFEQVKSCPVGAVITISKRRILIAISSVCPYQEIFATIYKRLSQLHLLL
jgi:hypothetical protein